MSMAHDRAVDALKSLLWELPAEFSHDNPATDPIKRGFYVIKGASARKIHDALWELQEYFGLQED